MVSNKLDIELSGEARRIIADARGFDDPTAEDRDRVKARWLASIAIAAGVSSFSDTARAASSGSWAFKGATLALAVAAGVAGLYFVLPDAKVVSREAAQPPAIPLPAEEPAALVAPSAEQVLAPHEVEVSPDRPTPSDVERDGRAEAVNPAQPSAPVEERRLLEAPARMPVPTLAVGGAPRRVTKPEQAPMAVDEAREEAGATSGQLSEEIALLSRVRAGVREGAGARALDLLAEYRERFERPILGMEASALSVDALCQTGQRDAARAAADKFRARWPESPLEKRVSSACTQF